MRRLLDADVLIGALDGNDAHHGRAREMFTQWRANQDACTVSVVNLTEVLIAPSADIARLASAREASDFTVPGRQPRASAMSRSVQSAQ